MDRVEAEYKQICLGNGLTEAELLMLSRDYGIFSIKTMAMFFEPEDVKASFRAQLFDRVTQWNTMQHVLPALRTSWLACVAVHSRRASDGGAAPLDLDEPIGTETHSRLLSTFESKHHFRIPPCWLCTDQIVAQFYRQLQARRMESITIQILPTGEDVVANTTNPAKISFGRGVSLQVSPDKRSRGSSPSCPFSPRGSTSRA